MKKALIPLAILLGAVIGAGGYFAADKLGKGSGPSEKPATAAEMAEVRKGLKTIQGQLAKLESKLGSLNASTKPPVIPPVTVPDKGTLITRPQPTRPDPDKWGTIVAKRYRTDYDKKILGDLRKTLKLDEDKWKKLRPIFAKHFAPVEAALKDIEAGKTRRLPKVNKLVAPHIPTTLARLKKALPAESWQAFDAWRKVDKKIELWRQDKGEYFLDGQTYKDYHVKKGTARSWFLLRPRLARLYQDYHPGKDKRERFEAVLKEHLNKVFLILQKEKNPNPFAPAVMAKLKALTKKTEVEIGKILGADGLAKFRAWKTAPSNPSCRYFGEPYRRPGQTTPVRPVPPPVTQPVPREEF